MFNRTRLKTFFPFLESPVLNQAGLTLIEMLVVTAVGAAFTLGLVNTVSMIQRQGMRNQGRGDWKGLLNLVNVTLSNSQQCTNFLQNIKFTGGSTIPLPSLGVVTTPISLSAAPVDTTQTPSLSSTNYSTEFLEVGKVVNNVCATSIKLATVPGGAELNVNPGVNKYQVYLSISGKQFQTNSLGQATPSPTSSPIGGSSGVSNPSSCTLSNITSGSLQPDLISGSVASAPKSTSPMMMTPDTISFVVYTSSNNKTKTEVITSCSAPTGADPTLTNTCQSLDGSTSLVNGKCVINSLNLNSANTLSKSVLNFGGTSPALSFQYNGTEALNLGPKTVSIPGGPAWMAYVTEGTAAPRLNWLIPPTRYASYSSCCQANVWWISPDSQLSIGSVLPSGCGSERVATAGYPTFTNGVEGYTATASEIWVYSCPQIGMMPATTVTVPQATFSEDMAITGNLTVGGAATVSGNTTAPTLTSGNINLTSGSSFQLPVPVASSTTTYRVYQIVAGGSCINTNTSTGYISPISNATAPGATSVFGGATCSGSQLLVMNCPGASKPLITFAVRNYDANGVATGGQGGFCVE